MAVMASSFDTPFLNKIARRGVGLWMNVNCRKGSPRSRDVCRMSGAIASGRPAESSTTTTCSVRRLEDPAPPASVFHDIQFQCHE